MGAHVPVGGQAQRLARPDAELGHVQGTFHHVAVDPALRERELLVAAGVIEGEVLAVDVVDGQGRMVALDPPGLARSQVAGLARRDPHCYLMTSSATLDMKQGSCVYQLLSTCGPSGLFTSFCCPSSHFHRPHHVVWLP